MAITNYDEAITKAQISNATAELKSISDIVTTMNETIKKAEWEQESLLKQSSDTKAKMDEAENNINIFSAVRELLGATAISARENARIALESTATAALQYIFDTSYSCKIEIPDDTQRPEAHIYIVQDTGTEIITTEPTYGNGGGIVDVVSVALRMAMVILQINPVLTGTINLDEPGKMVSQTHSVRLAEFLKHMSKQLNRQVIVTTHNQDILMSADKVIHVGMINKVSQVTDMAVSDI